MPVKHKASREDVITDLRSKLGNSALALRKLNHAELLELEEAIERFETRVRRNEADRLHSKIATALMT